MWKKPENVRLFAVGYRLRWGGKWRQFLVQPEIAGLGVWERQAPAGAMLPLGFFLGGTPPQAAGFLTSKPALGGGNGVAKISFPKNIPN